ncbi:MAG: leucine-rich repeat protein [Clostridia bacterium]|nr:leucine-rich repeat protein [Clostridia bacterium]
MKKLISLLLSIAMCFGLFPLTVGAASTHIHENTAAVSGSAVEEAPSAVADSAVLQKPAAVTDPAPEQKPAASTQTPDIAPKSTRSGKCGYNVNWILDTETRTLNITGTGAMTNYTDSSHAPWYSHKSYIKIVNIANGVTSIGNYAFYCCFSLTSIAIPDSVTSIGWYAFYYSSLPSITIPDSVTSIGRYAFSGTGYYNNTNNWENGVLYIGNHLTNTTTSLSGSYTIREDTKCIADDAFRNCSSLTSIAIPDSVTSIGDYAFEDCDSLTSITIPDSVTSIGVFAFYDCSSLTSITIGNGVTSIGNIAFKYCDSLTSITIGNSVTYIGDGAFGYCSSLTSITIPDSVTYIGRFAFFYCDSLTSITIGNSVTYIGEDAFGGCSSLTSITIGNGVTSIGFGAFEDCSSLTSITIPDSVTEIGGCAFYGCSSLTSVYIDSASIASKLSSKTACEYLINYAKAIMFEESITDIPHYVKNYYTYTESFIYNGKTYNSYSNHAHTWESYTGSNGCTNGCTNSGFKGDKCSVCSALKGNAVVIPHNYKTEWTSDGDNHWHECSVCGDKTDMASHVYDGDTDEDCNACGELRDVSGDDSTDTPENIPFGDVTGDGKANALDAAFVLRYDAGLIGSDKLDLSVADVTGDGKVNALDAAFILRFDAGLIPEL